MAKRLEDMEQLLRQGGPAKLPLLAVTVMIDPGGQPDGSDRIQVQWPPQVALEGVVQVLGIAMQTVAQMAQQEKTGLVLPRLVPPVLDGKDD